MPLDDFRLLNEGGPPSFVVVLADDGPTRIVARIARERWDDCLSQQRRELAHVNGVPPQIVGLIEGKYLAGNHTVYPHSGMDDERVRFVVIANDDPCWTERA